MASLYLNCYLYKYVLWSYNAALIVAITCCSWTTQHLIAIIIQHLREIVNLLFGSNREGKVNKTLMEVVLFLIFHLWTGHQLQSRIRVLETQDVCL